MGIEITGESSFENCTIDGVKFPDGILVKKKELARLRAIEKAAMDILISAQSVGWPDVPIKLRSALKDALGENND